MFVNDDEEIIVLAVDRYWPIEISSDAYLRAFQHPVGLA